MLHTSMILYNKIVSIPIICTVIERHNNNDNDTQEFLKRVKKAAIYSFVDTIIVGGIAFFSSIAAIGYDDLLMNVKIAFISSVVTAGLSFFTGMRNKIKVDNEDITDTNA